MYAKYKTRKLTKNIQLEISDGIGRIRMGTKFLFTIDMRTLEILHQEIDIISVKILEKIYQISESLYTKEAI